MYEFISQELVQLRFRKRPVIGGSDLWSVAEPIRGAEPVGGMAGVAQPPDRSDEMSGSVWFVVGEVEPGEADQGRAGQVWHPSQKGSPGLARQEVECFITSLECAKGDRTEGMLSSGSPNRTEASGSLSALSLLPELLTPGLLLSRMSPLGDW